MRSLVLAAVFVAGAAVPLRAQQQDAHDHDHGEVHSHRGPGPHFIDAFFTENAYIERKLRPDFFFSNGDEGQTYTAQLEVEWALIPNLAIITHIPFHHLSPELGSSETGLGDIGIGPKLAVVNDRQRFILAVGGDFDLPTGDADRGLGEEHAAFAPFVLAWLPFGAERRWLLQTSSHIEIPLTSEPASERVELSSAVSWTSPLGLTPILEGIVEFATDGGPATWYVAPEFRLEVGGGFEVGAGVRIPVSGPREDDYRLAIGAIRHFPLPR